MEIKTLADLVFQIIPQYDKPDCLQYKKNGKYQNLSAREVCEIVESLAAKLLDLGIRKGDRIGLLSENRPEWAYADLAILCSGALTVPIYCTLPAKQIEYIVNDS